MKHILRQLFANGLGLYSATLIGALVLGGDYFRTLVLSAVALTGLALILKPVLSLFLLPFNILTLGLTGWLIKLINIFILSKIVPGFSPVPFTFQGVAVGGVEIPAFSGGRILAMVVIVICVGLAGKVVHWIGD